MILTPHPRSYAALGLTLPAPRGGLRQATIPNRQPITSRAGNSPSLASVGGFYYEALTQSEDRIPIPLTNPAVMGLVYGKGFSGLGRQTLSLLSRYLYDNHSAVGYAVNTLANYSSPVLPQANSGDADWNRAAEDDFWDWMKRADLTGRFSFVELERLISIAIDTDGDIGAVFTIDPETNEPAIQLVESWLIGEPIAGIPASADYVDGVKLSKSGRVLGYKIANSEKGTKVSANEMILLHEADRFSCYRGVSPMRRGINDARDAQDIKAFIKRAAKLASALAAVMENGRVEENVWGDDAATRAAAAEAETPPTEQEKKITYADLFGGEIIALPEGAKLNVVSNTQPGNQASAFLDVLAGQFVMSLDIPPAFFLDEKLTGPNQRAVNAKASKKFHTRQELIGKFVKWAWVRYIGWRIENGLLAAVPGWADVELQFAPALSIDLGDDQKADQDAVSGGLKTLQKYHGKRGDDWLAEVDQSFVEIDYVVDKAKAVASKHGIPVEVVLNRSGFQIMQQQPQQSGKQGGAQ